MLKVVLAGVLFCGTGVTNVALAHPTDAPSIGLATHRAVYELSLASASQNSGVLGASGRFVYEFTGGPCAGYETDMRMVMDVAKDSDSVVTDQISSTFEDGPSKQFTFSNTFYSNYALLSRTNGEALRTDSQKIKLSLDADETNGEEPRDLDVQNAEFPTEYMQNVIDAARAGKHVYTALSFDGSGDKAMLAVTMIGAANREKARREEGESWPITTAYYPVGAAGGDETPGYSVSMELSESGISRDLLMDFGDFKIAGALTTIERVAPESCGQ